MNEKINKFLKEMGKWTLTFILLNIYWIGFTILGLGVFGFAPATYSVYGMIKEIQETSNSDQLFSKFFRIYKSKFFDANIIGIAYVLILLILGYNLILYKELSEFMSLGIWIYLFSFIFVLIINSFLIIFPLDMRFDYKNNIRLVTATFAIPFVFPIKTISYLISILALILVYYYLPFLILIFGITPFVFFTNGHIENVKSKMTKAREKKMN